MDNKVSIKLDLRTLDNIIAFIFSDNSNITRGNLSNIKSFMELIDSNKFKNEVQLLARHNFIIDSLKARIDIHMENKDFIINFAMKGDYIDIIKTAILPMLENARPITKSEIDYINTFVSERLGYIYLFEYKDQLLSVIEDLEGGDYESVRSINERFSGIISSMQNEIRRVRNNKEKNMRFDLSENFNTAVTQTIEEIQSPKNKLNTGYKLLNQSISGGFESGRVYCFMGLTGGFKSGVLLNLLYNIKLYNKYKEKNGRRGCILMVTMENDITETVERLFAMSVASSEDLKKHTPQEVMKLLKETGLFTVHHDDDIDVVIKYVPNRSISTANLYDIVEDLEDEGYDVLVLFQDYIKRIRSIENHTETRLELAAIVDEFKVLAQHKKIPVITAAQLNRDGARKIDAAQDGSKTDLARALGRENIGESWGMLENLDAAFIVNRERHAGRDGQEFITFKRIKIRYGKSDLTYFCQPFDLEKSFRIVSDDHLKEELGIFTMKVELGDLENNGTKHGLLSRGRSSAISREEIVAQPVTSVSDVEPTSFSAMRRVS